MTSPQFHEIQESNPWNPFDSTERDIKRTEQLAKKNPIVAGLLTFLLLPAAMIYLNRGVNSLKIWGYAMLVAIAFVSITETSEEKAFETGKMFGHIAQVFMIAENVSAVSRAKKRQQQS